MGGWYGPQGNRRPVWRPETQPSMRPVPVEVLRVVAKDPLEVSAAQDERPVQTLCADGAHSSLRVSVRVRRPDRRADDPGPTCLEHCVEGLGERGVAVTDQEPHGGLPVLERRGDGAACWVTQAGSGLRSLGLRAPSGCRARGRPAGTASSARPSSTVKKSTAMIPLACWLRNSRHVGPRRGAGPRPCARRIVAMVVAETLIPRPRSSPWIRWYPHLGFSLARRRTRLRVSGSMGGRPGRRWRFVHFLATSRRCHRRSVSGQTRNERQAVRGRTLLAAARKALSEVR